MANNRKSTNQTSGNQADAGSIQPANRKPYSNGALAAGAIGAVAAVAGLVLLRRSDKSLGEISSDLSGRVKDGLADAGSKARDTVSKLRPEQPKTQSEIAEEALTLKETGTASAIPANSTFDEPTSAGVVAN